MRHLLPGGAAMVITLLNSWVDFGTTVLTSQLLLNLSLMKICPCRKIHSAVNRSYTSLGNSLQAHHFKLSHHKEQGPQWVGGRLGAEDSELGRVRESVGWDAVRPWHRSQETATLLSRCVAWVKPCLSLCCLL